MRSSRFAIVIGICLSASLFWQARFAQAQSTSQPSPLKNVPANTLVDSDDATLYLWEGLTPFGSELPERPEYQAFSEFKSYFAAMNAWRSNLYLPNDSQPAWAKFRREVPDLSRADLLASTYKTVNFEGRWDDAQSMSFVFEPSASYRPVARLGELSAKASFSPGGLGEDYLLTDFHASIHLGSILFSEALESIETVNREFSPQAIERVMKMQSGEVAVELAREQAGYMATEARHLDAYSKGLLYLFRASLPRIMATMESVSAFTHWGSEDALDDGRAATRIQPKQKLRLSGLAEHFPGTYDDFKHLIKGVSFQTRILTDNGLTIGVFDYDADSRVFSADFTLVDGGFALRDTKGELTSQVVYPTQIKTFAYQLVNDMSISMYGVNVDVQALTMDAQYDAASASEAAQISLQLNRLPKVDVSGAFLYFLPTWLIDLLIPGTIETLIADAFADLIVGNVGEGFTLDMVFHEHAGEHIVDIKSRVELPLDVIQELLKIEDSGEGDEARLYRTIRQDLHDDFAAFYERVVR